jgi:hypothetical protein
LFMPIERPRHHLVSNARAAVDTNQAPLGCSRAKPRNAISGYGTFASSVLRRR